MDYFVFFVVVFILLALVHFDQRGKKTWNGKQTGSDTRNIKIEEKGLSGIRIRIQSFSGLLQDKVVAIKVSHRAFLSADVHEYSLSPAEAIDLARSILDCNEMDELPGTKLTATQASEIASALEYAANHV